MMTTTATFLQHQRRSHLTQARTRSRSTWTLHHQSCRQQRRNSFSTNTGSSSSSNRSSSQRKHDLALAMAHVRQHDPAGFLPGQLLSSQTTPTMKTSYYAVRNFWIETGLRFGGTIISGTPLLPAAKQATASPEARLEYWQRGIDALFVNSENNNNDNEANNTNSKAENSSNMVQQNPTLRLLHSLLYDDEVPWQKTSFDTILQGRRQDLNIQQYDTLDDLIRHAEQSCSHLNRLVLQGGFIDETTNPRAYEAARLVGIGHGLTNALRTSIPVISTTGKLIVPAELCKKYGVKSPRYLLSALGQGDDEKCVHALQAAVQDIVSVAREHLQAARALRPQILAEPDAARSLPVLLPALASETFLNRLQAHHYQLTSRELRNVSWWEQASCAGRMIWASHQETY